MSDAPRGEDPMVLRPLVQIPALAGFLSEDVVDEGVQGWEGECEEQRRCVLGKHFLEEGGEVGGVWGKASQGAIGLGEGGGG